MDVLSNRLVKVRKDHCCAYCNGRIEKGSMAVMWVSAEGGEIQRNYGHESCNDVVCELDVYGDEYIHDGYLEDTVNDFYLDNSSELPDKSIWDNLNVSQRCQLIMEIINTQQR